MAQATWRTEPHKIMDTGSYACRSRHRFRLYHTQLTYLLFLWTLKIKMFGEDSAIPEGYRWEDLTNLDGLDLVKQYENTLEKLSQELGVRLIYAKAQNKIDKPVYLKGYHAYQRRVVVSYGWRCEGAIYEVFWKRTVRIKKSGAGAVFHTSFID